MLYQLSYASPNHNGDLAGVKAWTGVAYTDEASIRCGRIAMRMARWFRASCPTPGALSF